VRPARLPAGVANPQPVYPYASRIRGEQGRVVLQVAVDPAGRVVDVAVTGSSGHAALDREAERTVRRWRFDPARLGDMPVFSSTSVGITFNLEGERRW
jgi:protein TonB